MVYNNKNLEFETSQIKILENLNYLEVYGLQSDAVILSEGMRRKLIIWVQPP